MDRILTGQHFDAASHGFDVGVTLLASPAELAL